ncbi:MAG TPA: cupin domain-containing protein [Nitrolancea sp.]|jgi:mannose-6-phosphate isomerase-like protein (cupin superfamily)|nr:cupin domain-containing protein [Nitrolancea sp.]
MAVTRNTEAQKFAVHGVEFRSYIRSATGSHELGAWQAEFPPHTAGVAHRMSVEEVFRVLSGRLVVEVDDARSEVTSGDVVSVPARAKFRVSNETDEAASAWVVTSLGMAFTIEGSSNTVEPPWAQ